VSALELKVVVRASADGRFTFQIFTLPASRGHFTSAPKPMRPRLMPLKQAMRPFPQNASEGDKGLGARTGAAGWRWSTNWATPTSRAQIAGVS
jgi:hypothetical protein